MIEYPSIINSSKAPRKHCYAFNKLDGSNFRAKYTPKQGFNVFGTRTQLVDETTPFWGEMVLKFKEDLDKSLTELFKSKDFRDYREIMVFGEFLGENSIAGRHEDEPHKVVVFDVLLGHKQRKFLKPQEFVKTLSSVVETPEVVYIGNLNDDLIRSVRNNEFGLKEGVICKGTEPSGAFVGGIWTCKIKTLEYLEKLKGIYGKDWEKYGE